MCKYSTSEILIQEQPSSRTFFCLGDVNKVSDESTLVNDPSIPLMHRDPYHLKRTHPLVRGFSQLVRRSIS